MSCRRDYWSQPKGDLAIVSMRTRWSVNCRNMISGRAGAGERKKDITSMWQCICVEWTKSKERATHDPNAEPAACGDGLFGL